MFSLVVIQHKRGSEDWSVRHLNLAYNSPSTFSSKSLVVRSSHGLQSSFQIILDLYIWDAHGHVTMSGPFSSTSWEKHWFLSQAFVETRDRTRQPFYHKLTPEPGLECHSLFSGFLGFIQYQAEQCLFDYLFVFAMLRVQVSKLSIFMTYTLFYPQWALLIPMTI